MNARMMTNEDLTQFANKVKCAIADSCNLPELDDCVVIIAEKGMFGKLWDKLWGLNENTCGIRVMREVKPAE